jgi:hypothetical protein
MTLTGFSVLPSLHTNAWGQPADVSIRRGLLGLEVPPGSLQPRAWTEVTWNDLRGDCRTLSTELARYPQHVDNGWTFVAKWTTLDVTGILAGWMTRKSLPQELPRALRRPKRRCYSPAAFTSAAHAFGPASPLRPSARLARFRRLSRYQLWWGSRIHKGVSSPHLWTRVWICSSQGPLWVARRVGAAGNPSTGKGREDGGRGAP